MQTTQTFLNQKIPVAKTKDNFGWEYELDGCKVRVHFLEDVVRYYSIELSQPACQFSWPALFNIQSPQRPQTRLTVGDILDGLYAQTYAPRLGMATGCIDCGNAHEPYVEFVTLNSHADGPYERYFTTDFYGWSNGGQYDLDFDSDHRRAFIEGIQRTLPGKDYWTIEQFCMQDISPDVMATLRSARVTAIGFSWAGRPEFRPDICNRS